jgi:hypothetical protein
MDSYLSILVSIYYASIEMGVVDDKNCNEDFPRKVLLRAYYYNLMIYIILVGETPCILEDQMRFLFDIYVVVLHFLQGST